MAKWLACQKFVAVLATVAGHTKVASYFKVIQDRADMTLGNANQGRQLGDFYVRILGNLDGNVAVVA